MSDTEAALAETAFAGTTGLRGLAPPLYSVSSYIVSSKHINLEEDTSLSHNINLQCLPRDAGSPKQRWKRQLLCGTDPLPCLSPTEARELLSALRFVLGPHSPRSDFCTAPLYQNIFLRHCFIISSMGDKAVITLPTISSWFAVSWGIEYFVVLAASAIFCSATT